MYEPLIPIRSQQELEMRRRERRMEIRKHRLRVTLSLPALIGVAVIAWQIIQDRPVPALVTIGVMLMVPWLATWQVRL